MRCRELILGVEWGLQQGWVGRDSPWNYLNNFLILYFVLEDVTFSGSQTHPGKKRKPRYMEIRDLPPHRRFQIQRP